MGINLPQANAGAGAPEVEDGLAVVRLDDIVQVSHPDWAKDDGPYGADDGERYHFKATLMEPSTETKGAFVPVYVEGDSIDLEAPPTSVATGKKSKFAGYMSGILTSQEFSIWAAGQPLTEDPKYGPLQGRLVNVKIGHNKNGWPTIEQFVTPIKVVK